MSLIGWVVMLLPSTYTKRTEVLEGEVSSCCTLFSPMI